MKNPVSKKQKAESGNSTPASCLLPPARHSGFTLVEALVAIAILTLSVAGPLTTASRAIVAAQNTSNQLTATYLAQEGLEEVRAMRDDAYLYEYSINPTNAEGPAGLGWSDFISGDSTHYGINSLCAGSYCQLDPTQSIGYPVGIGPNLGNSLTPCSSGGCATLNLLNSGGSNGYYQYTTQPAGSATSFTRTINVMNISPTDELIISYVSWQFHGSPYWVTATDHLTPWQ